jgi:hypothetical protein
LKQKPLGNYGFSVYQGKISSDKQFSPVFKNSRQKNESQINVFESKKPFGLPPKGFFFEPVASLLANGKSHEHIL